MLVLHAITGLSVGGAEAMMVKLLQGMDRSRFHPIVVSLMSGGPNREVIEELGIPVHELGMKPGLPGPGVLSRLARLARQLRPDLVQGWMYHGDLAAAWIHAWAPNSPALVWNIQHSLNDIRNEKLLTQAVIRLGALLDYRADLVLCNSKVSLEQHAGIGYRRDRMSTLPNGFDLQRYRPDPEVRRAVRKELGVPQDVSLVGTVARRHPMKGQEDFLRAAALVKRSHPDARFLMVGRGVEPGDVALEALAEVDPLPGSVRMIGQRSDPERIMAALDVFVVSSIFGEGSPNVLGEAMACGVPCVTTDIGDSAAVVDELGRVVAPGRPEELARGIVEILDLAADARTELGRRCREHVRDNYDLGAVARMYEDLYESLVPAGRPGQA